MKSIDHVHGLDRADAEAAGALARRRAGRRWPSSRRRQRSARVRPAVVVRAQVDAGEHDLADAGSREGRRLGHHLVGRAARRAAAGHVHDAVGAGVVAAVLHLHARRRVRPSAGDRREVQAWSARSCRRSQLQLARGPESRAWPWEQPRTRSPIGPEGLPSRWLAGAAGDDDACADRWRDRAWRTALRVFFSASPVTVQVFTTMRSAALLGAGAPRAPPSSRSKPSASTRFTLQPRFTTAKPARARRRAPARRHVARGPTRPRPPSS